MATLLLSVVAIGTVVSGCVISPQPQPPSISAEAIEVTYSFDDPEDPETARINLFGSPESISPGGADLNISNLDDPRGVTNVVVAEDGSFEASLSGSPGNRLYFQVIDESEQTRAIVVEAPPEEGPIRDFEENDFECIEISTGDVVDFGDVELGDIAAVEVSLRNACDAELIFDEPRLALNEQDDFLCAEEEAECYAGDFEETEICVADAEGCDRMCGDNYTLCIDDGNPEEDCFDQRVDCALSCNEFFDVCMEETCGVLLSDCYDSVIGPWDGFDATFAELPLFIDSDESRSFIITFAPVESGVAEEQLLFTLMGAEEQALVISLRGQGVE